MIKETKAIEVCNECGSEFFKQNSPMKNLCSNCSNLLYGYKNCDHLMQNGHCIKCGWNGKISEYLKNLKKDDNENF